MPRKHSTANSPITRIIIPKEKQIPTNLLTSKNIIIEYLYNICILLFLRCFFWGVLVVFCCCCCCLSIYLFILQSWHWALHRLPRSGGCPITADIQGQAGGALSPDGAVCAPVHCRRVRLDGL